MFSIFEKQPEKISFDFQQQLKSVPLRNEHIKVVSMTDDKLVVAVDLKYEGLMKPVSKLFQLENEKKYELEDIAFELYKKIDGKRTVENLIDEIKDTYQLTFFETHSLITQYLATLMKKGLVVVLGNEDDK